MPCIDLVRDKKNLYFQINDIQMSFVEDVYLKLYYMHNIRVCFKTNIRINKIVRYDHIRNSYGRISPTLRNPHGKNMIT